MAKPISERGRTYKRRPQQPIRPQVRGYEPLYPSNPIAGVLHELANDGRIQGMSLDERNYLADLLADGLCIRADMTGMGAAVNRRIMVFLKGRLREDAIG